MRDMPQLMHVCKAETNCMQLQRHTNQSRVPPTEHTAGVVAAPTHTPAERKVAALRLLAFGVCAAAGKTAGVVAAPTHTPAERKVTALRLLAFGVCAAAG